MVFDELELESELASIRKRMNELNVAKNELEVIHSSLVSIQDEEYFETVENIRVPKKRRKKDVGTNEDVTDTRRDEIFDKLIPKGKSLVLKQI